MSRLKRTVALSRSAHTLITRFAEAAQDHGWQRDQGNGASVDNALGEYNTSKRLLELFIERLERKVQS